MESTIPKNNGFHSYLLMGQEISPYALLQKMHLKGFSIIVHLFPSHAVLPKLSQKIIL